LTKRYIAFLIMLGRQEQISAHSFQHFSSQAKSLYCAICCVLLYPSKVKFRNPPSGTTIVACTEWGFPPILTKDNKIIVCSKHKTVQDWTAPISFPGNIPQQLQNLNYLEQACLSPIKIMSQITRNISRRSYCLGHFCSSGDIWMDYNYLFSGLMFHGSLGLFYNERDKHCK
jgi:hypothetical protein